VFTDSLIYLKSKTLEFVIFYGVNVGA